MSALPTFGLLIEATNTSDAKRVTARVVRRDGGKDYPLNVSSFRWELPKHLQKYELDGLGLYGFIGSGDQPSFIGFDPEYRDVYAIELPQARRMVATLAKIQKVQERLQAREAGDVFIALAKALNLDFVCKRVGERADGTYPGSDWHFTTIETGRNMYRDLIDKAVETAKLEAA